MKKKVTNIFPHIPKCGGTSLKSQFESSDLLIYFDYEHPPHNSKKYMNRACKRRNWENSLLNFKEFDLVFGHFPLKRYHRINYQYIVLIRHPLDRAISHFFYWKNALPKTNLIALQREPIIKEIKNGRIGFIDFLKNNRISDFYTSYLNDKKPSDFRLVGIFDEYETFTAQLSEMLNIQIDANIHIRKGIRKTISQEEYRIAEKLLKSDIERYNEFKAFWTK